LIAKVVAHGTDREEAINRMRRALGMLIIDGIDSTISLHRRILEDAEFRAGQIDTKFIERLLSGKDEPRVSPPTPLLDDSSTLNVA
jgi:acetyl-CoA carboxylase biotin carboxylase subunit